MRLAWGKKVSPSFARKAIRIANEIGVPPDHLMACMAFEAVETFSASIVNKTSGATGLIQFMRPTAKGLGTTTAELARMTAEQQLDYVLAYFKPYIGKLHTIDDLYMAILWPKAVGKSAGYVLFDRNSPPTEKAYAQNKGLDIDRNGQVTKAEAAAGPRGKLTKGLTAGLVAEIDVDEPGPEDVIPDEFEDTGTPMPRPRPVDVPLVAPTGLTIKGDPVTWWIQYHLRVMNYSPGTIDGLSGGKTFGAVAAFLTDWDEMYGDLQPPKSGDDFEEIKSSLYRELNSAGSSGFKRPVTEARENLDPEVVKEVAPEATTQRRGIIATAWGAIVTFFGSILTSAQDTIGRAWDWVSGNKDNLPDAVTDPGMISMLLKKIGSIPPGVWLLGMTAILVFVGFGLARSLKQTTDQVRTGLR